MFGSLEPEAVVGCVQSAANNVFHKENIMNSFATDARTAKELWIIEFNFYIPTM